MTTIASDGSEDNPQPQFIDTHWDLTAQLIDLIRKHCPDHPRLHSWVDRLLAGHESLSSAWRREVEL